VDVQAAPVNEHELSGFEPPAECVAKDSVGTQVSAVIERLNQASRPLLMIGNGVRLAGAEAAMRQVKELLGIPVASTWVAMDMIGEEDPLFMGRPGTVAPRYANFALQNCDFLLSIGARLDLPTIGWNPQHFARGACKVVVDVDAAELGKLNGVADLTVCAGADVFFGELLRQRSAIQSRDRQCWLRRCQDWKARYPLVQTEYRKAEGPVSIYHFAEIMAEEVIPEDSLIAANSGSAIEIFLLAYPVRRGQRLFHTAGLGAMGIALPASIGVCFANGQQRTICVDADGGFQLNIQELATVAHWQLPIKFFILNNGGYAAIRGSQTNFFGGPNIGCDERTGVTLPDFQKVARAYGLKTAVIADQRDLRRKVRRVLAMPGPVVCDVRVIPDEVRAPRVTSVQKPDGSFVSKPLEDLWPLLDRDEFHQNMIVPPLEE
jgi:acetolactate synthase-1/2/3 large subunit